MSTTGEAGTLAAFANEITSVVERAGRSVVRVDDGSRLTAGGIIYNTEGLIVATSHGVERDEDLVVETADGARLEATLVGRDSDTDIALLRVDAAGLDAIEPAPAGSVKVGNLAFAVARPGRSGLEATLGLVTGRIETESNGRAAYIVHTDAALYPGFSGGALINASGQAVGLLNLVFGRGRGVALGMPVVDAAVEALLKHGGIKRGFLGVRTQLVPLPDSLRNLPEVDQENALLIVGLENGGPAEQAGVQLGDTLIAIGEKTVTDVDSLRSVLRGLAAGEVAVLKVIRGGQIQHVDVTLGNSA